MSSFAFIPGLQPKDGLQVAILFLVMYLFLRFLRRTIAGGVFRGPAMLVWVLILGGLLLLQQLKLDVLGEIFRGAFPVFILALVVTFQIELRHSSRFMELYSRSYLRDYFQLIAGILEEGQQRGEIRADLDVWMATKCIFGILDEAATNWVLSKKNYRLHGTTDPILDFVMRGLAAPAV